MKVAIIYGGKSSEHEISIRSASSLVRNLDKKEDLILIGIAKDSGKWYEQDASIKNELLQNANGMLPIVEDENNLVHIMPGGRAYAFSTKKKQFEVDVVFPILHGAYGEDGSIQGLLEISQIPYVGPAVMGSSIAMDKEIAKILWQNAGLSVVPYLAIKKIEWSNSVKRSTLIDFVEKDFGYPMFIKPSSEGSSVGTAKVQKKEELFLACDEAFKYGNKILIEKFINAREIECSVTGYEHPIVYTVGEIVSHHDFYDYNAKYIDANGASLKIPADLEDLVCKKIRDIAAKAYEVLELSSLSRIDFLVDKKDGTIYLNEANTIPGFTSISMFPKLCEAAGLPYKDLITLLLNDAIKHHASRFIENASSAF